MVSLAVSMSACSYSFDSARLSKTRSCFCPFRGLASPSSSFLNKSKLYNLKMYFFNRLNTKEDVSLEFLLVKTENVGPADKKSSCLHSWTPSPSCVGSVSLKPSCFSVSGVSQLLIRNSFSPTIATASVQGEPSGSEPSVPQRPEWSHPTDDSGPLQPLFSC